MLRHIHAGNLTATRIGGRYYVSLQALEAWRAEFSREALRVKQQAERRARAERVAAAAPSLSEEQRRMIVTALVKRQLPAQPF